MPRPGESLNIAAVNPKMIKLILIDNPSLADSSSGIILQFLSLPGLSRIIQSSPTFPCEFSKSLPVLFIF